MENVNISVFFVGTDSVVWLCKPSQGHHINQAPSNNFACEPLHKEMYDFSLFTLWYFDMTVNMTTWIICLYHRYFQLLGLESVTRFMNRISSRLQIIFLVVFIFLMRKISILSLVGGMRPFSSLGHISWLKNKGDTIRGGQNWRQYGIL